MSISIRPVKNRVVVKAVEESDEKVRPSGLILTDSASLNDGLIRVEVLAVGPGVMDRGSLIPVDVSVGQIVLVSRYSGTEVKVDDDELLILLDTDIVAIVG